MSTKRDVLLTKYMQDVQLWQELIESIDEVFGTRIDDMIPELQALSESFRLNTEDRDRVLDDRALLYPDRDTLIRRVVDMGFRYPILNDNLFNSAGYNRLLQNLGMYYRERGTQAFLDFFGFCLDDEFTLKATWTEDYVEFIPEGDPRIGTPVWEGGTWYPTTHVLFEVDIGAQTATSISPDLYRDFFYYIAPINLVLLATVLRLVMEAELALSMAGVMQVEWVPPPPLDNEVKLAMGLMMMIHYGGGNPEWNILNTG